MLSGGWEPELDFELAFYDALEDLDPDSTPGYCQFALHGTTIGQIFGYDPDAKDYMNPTGFTDGVMVEAFKSYVLERMRILSDTDQLIYDPIKVFIKREPHKTRKLQEGRLRLISAVSMVDTMIDRILFREFFAWLKDVKSWPCFYGYTPVVGGYRTPRKMFAKRKVLSTDKQCWDWTVQEWVLMAIYHFIRLKAIFADDEDEKIWTRLALKRFQALYRHAVFQFADGHKIAQKQWGIQKSGCYGTLAFNSLGQWFLELYADPDFGRNTPSMFVGDDVIRSLPRMDLEEYRKKLQDGGCIVKDLEVSGEDESFEFCGFTYHRDRMPTPAYRQKHNFLLAHCKLGMEAETLQSYQLLYAFDPFIRKIQKALLVYHPDGLKSKAALKETWDG